MATWDITTASASQLEFDIVQAARNTCVVIDSNHVFNMWSGSGDDGFCNIFTINTTTWAVTTAGTNLEFDTAGYTDESPAYLYDANHIVALWSSDSDKFAQVFAIDTTTWQVSTAGARFAFSTTTGSAPFGMVSIDSTHFFGITLSSLGNGSATMFAINTTTWAITTAGSTLALGAYYYYTSPSKVDANHVIDFWNTTGTQAFCGIYEINTTTWAITTKQVAFAFETSNGDWFSSSMVDANHCICFYKGPGNDGYVQVFTIDTTTWAITTSSALFEFENADISHNVNVRIDTNHYLNFFGTGDTPVGAKVQTFAVNTSTWEVTTVSTALTFSTVNSDYIAAGKLDNSHYISFWNGVDDDGFAQTFYLEYPSSGPANLKTYNTNVKSNIKTINTNVIANVKTLNTNA